MRKNCKLRTNEKVEKKTEKFNKLKNKVKIWQIEKLQTIVKTKKKLKEKNSFKKKSQEWVTNQHSKHNYLACFNKEN